MSKQYRWTYRVTIEDCMSCAACETECQSDAVYIYDNLAYAIDEEKCTRYARCYQACPVGAIEKISNQVAV